jgi:hypothetical protein
MPKKRDLLHTAGLPRPAPAQSDRPGLLGAKDIAEAGLQWRERQPELTIAYFRRHFALSALAVNL